jgi:hypothetical protein
MKFLESSRGIHRSTSVPLYVCVLFVSLFCLKLSTFIVRPHIRVFTCKSLNINSDSENLRENKDF